MRFPAFLLALALAAPLYAQGVSPPPPQPRERCAVCGMYVTAYPDWVAALVSKDGKALYFDGPKDMFKYLYFGDGKKDKGAWEAWVTVEGAGMIRALSALFVVGSDLLGPMGDDLAPLADETETESFIKEHGGKVVRFGEITPELVRGLD